MTTDRIERRLPEILEEISVPQVPDYLDDILSQTARIRPRPGWTFPERWLPMDIALRARGGPLTGRTFSVLVLLAVAVALGVAALVFLGSQSRRLPPPYGPASNGSIIYERAGDIFITDAEGHFETSVIGGTATDYAPRWSRDGTTIIFGRKLSSGTAVMAADADGRNVRQLSPSLLHDPEVAEVSPDGTKLATIDHGSGGDAARLAILDLVGDRPLRTLDLGTIRPATDVDWQPPRGDHLVFLGHPDGLAAELALYMVRPDGSGLQRLVVQHGESVTDPRTQISFQDLALSDDGRTAAYWNWETTVEPGRSCFVHVVDLETGRDRRWTFDPSAACEVHPAFLADGRIVVERQDDQGFAQLLVAPADASVPGYRIGPEFAYRHRLGWAVSPDRREVLLVLDFAESQLVTIGTGSNRFTKLSLPDAGSWQRLAP